MRELFILIAHLLVTLAKLGRPGGLGAVAAESLAVKHQLLIMKRAQRRAPNLTSWDRLLLGVCALFGSPKRLSKMAVILKTSTLLCFHHALVKRKYQLLYRPRKRLRPGPKGPSKELIGAVIWLFRPVSATDRDRIPFAEFCGEARLWGFLWLHVRAQTREHARFSGDSPVSTKTDGLDGGGRCIRTAGTDL
jgi:hypothetical protein